MTTTSSTSQLSAQVNALAVVGDRWTLLILYDCFVGVRRFEQFERNLRIGRSQLSERLQLLVAEGILEKQAYQDRPVRREYLLTAKGMALRPVLVAISEFGAAFYPSS